MSAPVVLTQRPVSAIVSSRLASRGGMDPFLAKLFAARGVTSAQEVSGTYQDLLPAGSMKNVGAMASFLADCMVRQRRVLIVSDYDCDGATACAVLVMAFMGAGMNFGYLVPDRMKHGYGLTPAIVEEAAALDERPEVIITVDNGISSTAGVDRANELGIEVLVTDHHLAPDVLPNARLIVNPNQPGCDFASKNIAGCGVAWYVARAFIEELKFRNMDCGFDPAELLSYVALGTVADVVKLDRNNRILVALGLDLIRKEQCAPGVIELARVSGKNFRALTCSDIGFGIGPRINAAGRLAHMRAGVECLTTMDFDLANSLAKQLHTTNEERKDIQREMVDQALIQAILLLNRQQTGPATDSFGRRSIVVFHSDWHEGVVGIVAGRLKEDRHRPTIVMTTAQDGTIKGSGRSIPGFHLKHALDELNVRHPGVLLKFGGHAMAAGMTIAPDKLEEFREAFETICQQQLTPQMLTKTLLHDGAYPESRLNAESIQALSQLVWGQGFEEPVFLNRVTVEEAKVIGEDRSHLKIKGCMGSMPLDIMAFGQADLVESLGTELVIAHKPQVNVFCEQVNLQLLTELLPESLNPQLSSALREREELAEEAAAASAGSSHDPGPAPLAAAAPTPVVVNDPAPAANDQSAQVTPTAAPRRQRRMSFGA